MHLSCTHETIDCADDLQKLHGKIIDHSSQCRVKKKRRSWCFFKTPGLDHVAGFQWFLPINPSELRRNVKKVMQKWIA